MDVDKSWIAFVAFLLIISKKIYKSNGGDILSILWNAKYFHIYAYYKF